MKWIALVCIIIQGFQYTALADTPPPGTVKIKGGTDGAIIGNSGDSLKVSATIGLPTNAAQETGGHLASIDTKLSGPIPVTGTFWQATQPVSGTLGRTWSLLNSSDSVQSFQGGSWTVGVNNFPSSFTANIGTTGGLALDASLSTLNTTLGTPFQAGGSIGNTAFGISGTLPAFASTPTFNLGTLNGAATNATLLTINSTLGTPFQAGASIGNTAFGISGTLPAFASTPTFNLGTIGTAATEATLSTLNGKVTAVNTGNVTISSSALPSGAATEASLSSLNSKVTAVDTGNVTVGSSVAATGRSKVNIVRNDYSGVNVTTAAYVQLIASTADVINYLDVFDSSGQTLVLAVGGAGSEVDQFNVVPGGNGSVPLRIPAGSRISVKAVSGTASSGELDISTFK